MRILLWLAVLCAILACALSGVIPDHSEGIFVATLNETAVCVVNRTVYQDGERLPMEDACEICRCRPPGFACAYVRCAKKDPKPGCDIVELVGQCCPQYRCADQKEQARPPQPQPPQPQPNISSSSSKPEAQGNSSNAHKVDGREGVTNNAELIASTQANAEENRIKEEVENSSAAPSLEERAGVISSSQRPNNSDEESGKSLDVSSPIPELLRDDKIETNEILSDPSNSSESEQEQGRHELQSSSLPPPGQGEHVDARSEEGLLKTLPETAVKLDTIKETPLADEPANVDASTAPSGNLRSQEEIASNVSPSAGLLISADKVEKIPEESKQESSSEAILAAKAEDENSNATMWDEPKPEITLTKEEKLDITILKDQADNSSLANTRKERDTVLALDEKIPESSSSAPRPQEELKKPSEDKHKEEKPDKKKKPEGGN